MKVYLWVVLGGLVGVAVLLSLVMQHMLCQWHTLYCRSCGWIWMGMLVFSGVIFLPLCGQQLLLWPLAYRYCPWGYCCCCCCCFCSCLECDTCFVSSICWITVLLGLAPNVAVCGALVVVFVCCCFGGCCCRFRFYQILVRWLQSLLVVLFSVLSNQALCPSS